MLSTNTNMLQGPLLLVLILLSVGDVLAGGFDNTGRPFGIIFGADDRPNELRLSYTHISPEVDGNARPTRNSASISNVESNELIANFENIEWAIRYRVNDKVSCAVRFEEPFRAEVRYRDDSLSYTHIPDSAEPEVHTVAPIASVYESDSLSVACRYGWLNDFQRFYVFGGPKYQKVKGSFSSDLSALSLGSADNLSVNLGSGREFGYLAGIGYEIPSLAVRVSLIYHSEIEYTLKGESYTPVPDFTERIKSMARAKMLTPQSVHLNLQTGVAEGWLVFGEFKWSEWRKVDQIEVVDGILNPSLGLFKNNTVDVNLGVINVLSERLQVGVSYNTGFKLGGKSYPAGVDGTNLRSPAGDRQRLGLGVSFLFTEHLSFDSSISYTQIEDTKTVTDNYIFDLENAYALSIGVGMSWFY